MSDAAPSKDELLMAEFMGEQQLVSLIREIVDSSEFDRNEIAKRLGVHRSNISKLLNAPRNMTVRMAARLLRAAGHRLLVGSVPISRDHKLLVDGHKAAGGNIRAFTDPTFQPRIVASKVPTTAAIVPDYDQKIA